MTFLEQHTTPDPRVSYRRLGDLLEVSGHFEKEPPENWFAPALVAAQVTRAIQTRVYEDGQLEPVVMKSLQNELQVRYYEEDRLRVVSLKFTNWLFGPFPKARVKTTYLKQTRPNPATNPRLLEVYLFVSIPIVEQEEI